MNSNIIGGRTILDGGGRSFSFIIIFLVWCGVVVPRAYYTHFIPVRFDIRITTNLTWPIMHKHTSNSGHWSTHVAYFTDARKQ